MYMPTYLTHPEHGTHIAYSEMEIENCKQNGWSVYGSEPPRKAIKEPPPEILGVPRQKRKYTKRAK